MANSQYYTLTLCITNSMSWVAARCTQMCVQEEDCTNCGKKIDETSAWAGNDRCLECRAEDFKYEDTGYSDCVAPI